MGQTKAPRLIRNPREAPKPDHSNLKPCTNVDCSVVSKRNAVEEAKSFDVLAPQILVRLAVGIESTTPSRYPVKQPLHVGDWGILGIESAVSNSYLNKNLKP